MKRRYYKVDSEDHMAMLIGWLWFFGILVAIGVARQFLR